MSQSFPQPKPLHECELQQLFSSLEIRNGWFYAEIEPKRVKLNQSLDYVDNVIKQSLNLDDLFNESCLIEQIIDHSPVYLIGLPANETDKPEKATFMLKGKCFYGKWFMTRLILPIDSGKACGCMDISLALLMFGRLKFPNGTGVSINLAK